MNESSDAIVKSRWPGLLLSFFVAGFGLFRAGLWRRGAAWLIGLWLLNLLAGISFALEFIPIWVSVVMLISCLVASICMLRDGFRPGKMTWRLWLLFVFLIIAFVIAPSPILSVARTFRVPTSGMEPTLCGEKSVHGADHVIADTISYRLSPPQRGDIVVFSTSNITAIHEITGSSEENYFVQRLVGMPGERIKIKEGKVFVNDRQLGAADGLPDLEYQNPMGFPTAVMKDGEEFKIGANEYFVLGDNTSNSLDSRYWGCVPKSSVYGKVTKIYYPFKRMSKLPSK